MLEYSVKANGRLWLIGGTVESSQLAAAIARSHLPCTISVTTETARSLYPDVPYLQVWVGTLDLPGMAQFLQAQEIVAVLDASHPFAVDVSRNAIAVCTQYQIPYLRYQRPSLEVECGIGGEWENSQKIIHFGSISNLVTGDYLQGERVLLTLGYKALPLFRPWQERSTLFARILPATTSIEAAKAAGFKPDRLFAMRPPISADLERALWRHWQISMVVTKASGASGGEDIKRMVADELGVSLVIIDPPAIDYPQVTSNLSEAISFCQQYLSQN